VEEQSDSTFIKNISIVLVILIVFTISIAFVARDIGFKNDEASNPSRQTTTEERISPVSGVHTGEAGAAAIQQAAAEVSSGPSVAFEGSLDGEMIYTSVCAACHTAGVAGAPQPGSAAMAERAQKGNDALMQTVMNGLNAMPARGGRPDLSDEQLQAVVDFMLQ